MLVGTRINSTFGNVCQCGNECIIAGYTLKSGYSTKCKKCRIKSTKKHGETHTRLYNIWADMKSRVLNANLKSYKNYGERGVTISEEWKEFLNFRSWALNSGYNDNLTIERIDNNGNYEPLNCKWATRKEQAKNRRTSYRIEYEGEQITLKEYAEKTGISYGTMKSRLYRGWELEKAITRPKPKPCKR